MRLLRGLLVACVGVALVAAVVVVAMRVGDQARFVTWTVVLFTALAAGVAIAATWIGSRTPVLLLVGVLPAAVVSYFLPAAPLAFIAVGLVAMGAAAILARGVAAGLAAWTGGLLVLLVLMQGPAVTCGNSEVATNSGPWWIDEPSESFGSGSSSADGISTGTVQVGDHHYRYSCQRGRLGTFARIDR